MPVLAGRRRPGGLESLTPGALELFDSFANAYEAFPWRKAHMAIRAYLQNSAALKSQDY
jgi:hypothetical protein